MPHKNFHKLILMALEKRLKIFGHQLINKLLNAENFALNLLSDQTKINLQCKLHFLKYYVRNIKNTNKQCMHIKREIK